jgi:hypothetical protein
VAADGKPEAFRKGSGKAAKVHRTHDEVTLKKIFVAALLRFGTAALQIANVLLAGRLVFPLPCSVPHNPRASKNYKIQEETT